MVLLPWCLKKKKKGETGDFEDIESGIRLGKYVWTKLDGVHFLTKLTKLSLREWWRNQGTHFNKEMYSIAPRAYKTIRYHPK